MNVYSLLRAMRLRCRMESSSGALVLQLRSVAPRSKIAKQCSQDLTNLEKLFFDFFHVELQTIRHTHVTYMYSSFPSSEFQCVLFTGT